MKWLARYATRVAVRRVVAILVFAIIAWACSGTARAESYPCSTNPAVPQSACYSRQEAMAAGEATFANFKSGFGGTTELCEVVLIGSNNYQFKASFNEFGCGAGGNWYRSFVTDDCPAGTVWNDFLKKCDSACSTKPPLGPTIGLLQMEVCVGGCKYAGVPTKQISLESGPSGSIDFGAFAGFTPTGEQCGTPDQAKPEPYCAPINGQTVCVRPDGSHCHQSATTKRFFCWRPGETGEKADGPDVSKTNAGPNAIPPNINLPNGDNLTPAGSPVTATTTINNSTSTTTTNNYTTEYGTNAGTGPDAGQGNEEGPGNGGGDGGDGDGGDGDGDKGSISGPGDCSAPPVCAGNALACWAIRANWQQGCDGVASGIEGMAELGDAINRATEAEAVEWGALLGTDGEGDLDSIREVRELKGSELDASGFLGAGTCPNFPMPSVMGQTLNIDFTQICGFLSNIGSIVLALSYLLGFRIIVGGGRK